MEKNDKNEILGAINSFADNVQGQLDGIKDDVSGLKDDVSGLKDDVSGLKDDVSWLKDDVSGLKSEVTQIKATMVTKDYLDDKFFDLRGDLNIIIRKEDVKVTALIKKLTEKKVLSEQDEDELLTMEPFARFG